MKKRRGWLFLVFIGLTFFTCGRQFDNREKILYLNSYHPGYGSSDDITEGILETVDTSEFKLKIIYMDSKNNPSEGFLLKKAEGIYDQIQDYQPGVIIVSDDNAVKFVVEPYLKDGPVPVVFCGVNWTAEMYGLPNKNVTGMLEILPVREGIKQVQEYLPEIKKVFILSENTVSEKKNLGYISELLEEQGFVVEYALADSLSQWKNHFRKANHTADVIYLPTNGGIKGWLKEEAITFVTESIQVPTVTCDDFMMPYSVIGVTKLQKEQGLWAAKTAIMILEGSYPADYPVAENTQTENWFNPVLAEVINFRADSAFMKQAKIFTY